MLRQKIWSSSMADRYTGDVSRMKYTGILYALAYNSGNTVKLWGCNMKDVMARLRNASSINSMSVIGLTEIIPITGYGFRLDGILILLLYMTQATISIFTLVSLYHRSRFAQEDGLCKSQGLAWYEECYDLLHSVL